MARRMGTQSLLSSGAGGAAPGFIAGRLGEAGAVGLESSWRHAVAALAAVLEQVARTLSDVLGREVQVAVHVRVRGRCAKAVQADHVARLAHPALTAERNS